MLSPEGQNVIDANASGDAPAPHQRLTGGAIGAFAAAECVGKGYPATQRKADDRAAFRGVDELTAGFAGAVGKILFVFRGAGEVATLHLDAEVTIEPGGDTDGCVGVVNALELVSSDAAIEGMEIAVAAVDIDARVNMLFAALCRLRRGGCRSSPKTEENQSQPSPLSQALHCGDSSRYPVQIEAFLLRADVTRSSLESDKCVTSTTVVSPRSDREFGGKLGSNSRSGLDAVLASG